MTAKLRASHPLVTRAVRFGDHGGRDRRERLRRATVKVLGSQLEALNTGVVGPDVEPLIPHARQLAGAATELPELTLLAYVARYNHARGVFAAARELQVRVLRRELLGDQHPHTLMAMGNLAARLWAQGELGGARELQERVLEERRELLGDQHPHTLTAMNNLAGTLWAQGELGGARELQERVLEERRELLGDQHPHTLTAMNNLAGTLRAQGELGGARELQERVLEEPTARRRCRATTPSSRSTINRSCSPPRSSVLSGGGARALGADRKRHAAAFQRARRHHNLATHGHRVDARAGRTPGPWPRRAARAAPERRFVANRLGAGAGQTPRARPAVPPRASVRQAASVGVRRRRSAAGRASPGAQARRRMRRVQSRGAVAAPAARRTAWAGRGQATRSRRQRHRARRSSRARGGEALTMTSRAAEPAKLRAGAH